MKRAALASIVLIGGTGIGAHLADAQPERAAVAAVRFAAVDVYVDSAEPLAAWQFELTESSGAMAVVGVENGDSDAYPDAPHFDLSVVQRNSADRIVVADYSLAEASALPTGRTRIATVHVRLMGGTNPEFDLQLIAAGDPSGTPIAAEAILEIQDGSAQ